MRIAINGIGVAGPTLAYWLQRYGYEPVMFERAPQLRTGGYLIDFWGRGYDVAERMGLAELLHERGYRIDEIRAVHGDGTAVASVGLSAVREQVRGRFISIPRGDLACALYERCVGVESHFGRHITGLTQRTDGVRVDLSDGEQQRYDLVIGADGVHSHTRRQIFDEDTSEHAMGCWVVAFRLKGYPHRDEGAYVTYTEPRRQVARASLRGDETLVLMVCGEERFGDELGPDEPPLERIRAAFSGMAWEVPTILARLEEAEQLYVDRVSQVRLPRWSKGRVALLGDAAACISLLGGEGTGLAMFEAYVLAGELYRACGDHAQAFAAYERRLSEFLQDKQRSAGRMIHFFAPRSRMALKLRDLGLQVASLPLMSRVTANRLLADDIAMPAYENPKPAL